MHGPTASRSRAARNTVGDLLTRSAARYRDKVALRWGEAAWSYRALDDAADRAARALLASGLRAGDRVVAYGRNSDLYLLAWLACCKAGLVHVAANYALTGAGAALHRAAVRRRLLLHDPALAEDAARAGVPARLFADALRAAGRAGGGGGGRTRTSPSSATRRAPRGRRRAR